MHTSSVTLRLPGGARETLHAGDLIGRAWSAALRFDDPQLSEAHALVSLRGERLWLLSLRRRLIVDGKAVDAVPLAPGLTVRLTPEIEVVVDEVTLPDAVLGLVGPGLPLQALPGTCGLRLDPHPSLGPLTSDAIAQFWVTEGRWRARAGDGPARDLGPGDRITAGGREWTAEEIALGTAGHAHTRASADGPLRIVSSFDTVQIHRADGEVLVLAGQVARVLAELVSVGQPVAWEELARQHWPHIAERETLRRRWDGLLVRLRERLREGGVRPDLIASSGIGLVELVLKEVDVVVDQS